MTEKKKLTKQGYVAYLRGAKIESEELQAKVDETLAKFSKDMRSVTKEELMDLTQEVIAEVGLPEKAPVEYSLKPASKKKGSKKDEAPAKKAPAKKKGSAKKDKDEDSSVETIPPVSNVGTDNLPSAKVFPAEVDYPGIGKIVACTDEFTTYAEVLEALEADKTLYFACYWNKRQIKEFAYAVTKMVDPKTVKKGFPHDLDLLMAVLPCETMERVYAMSRITEALFQFEGEDFQYVEDVDPRSGDQFKIRVSAGMEFEIYRPADEVEA